LGGLKELGFPGGGWHGSLEGKVDWKVGILSDVDLRIIGLHGFLKPVEHFCVYLAQFFYWMMV
jgi:hypothetical protein